MATGPRTTCRTSTRCTAVPATLMPARTTVLKGHCTTQQCLGWTTSCHRVPRFSGVMQVCRYRAVRLHVTTPQDCCMHKRISLHSQKLPLHDHVAMHANIFPTATQRRGYHWLLQSTTSLLVYVTASLAEPLSLRLHMPLIPGLQDANAVCTPAPNQRSLATP